MPVCKPMWPVAESLVNLDALLKQSPTEFPEKHSIKSIPHCDKRAVNRIFVFVS